MCTPRSWEPRRAPRPRYGPRRARRRCNAGMTMHFRSTQPRLTAAALPVPPGARRSAGPGPYQESTLELWRGAQVLPLAVSTLPGELLIEFERQRGVWGSLRSLQART